MRRTRLPCNVRSCALFVIARYVTCFRYAFKSRRAFGANGGTKSTASAPQPPAEHHHQLSTRLFELAIRETWEIQAPREDSFR
jgi:hypothetical protein